MRLDQHLRIDHERLAEPGDRFAGAQRHADCAGLADAAAERVGEIVARAGRDGQATRQAGQLGASRAERSRTIG